MIQLPCDNIPIDEAEVVLPSDPALELPEDEAEAEVLRERLFSSPGDHRQRAHALPGQELTWWTIRSLTGPEIHRCEVAAHAGPDHGASQGLFLYQYSERLWYEMGAAGCLRVKQTYEEAGVRKERVIEGQELRRLLEHRDMRHHRKHLGRMIQRLNQGDIGLEGK